MPKVLWLKFNTIIFQHKVRYVIQHSASMIMLEFIISHNTARNLVGLSLGCLTTVSRIGVPDGQSQGGPKDSFPHRLLSFLLKYQIYIYLFYLRAQLNNKTEPVLTNPKSKSKVKVQVQDDNWVFIKMKVVSLCKQVQKSF